MGLSSSISTASGKGRGKKEDGGWETAERKKKKSEGRAHGQELPPCIGQGRKRERRRAPEGKAKEKGPCIFTSQMGRFGDKRGEERETVQKGRGKNRPPKGHRA